LDTLPKFNIAPENDGLEDDVPFPGVYSILRFHVNLPGCNHNFAYSSEGNEFKRISRSFSSNSFSCRTKSMVIVIGG